MPETPLAKILEGADPSMLGEILRGAETHIAMQAQMAIAADQRAYTFAGLMTAASAVLVGGSYSIATAPDPDAYLAFASALTAGGLLLAASLAMHSARPIGFDYPGSQPGSWDEDVEAKKPLQVAIAQQCHHHDKAISDNRKRMESNSDWMMGAYRVSQGAALYGAATFGSWLVDRFLL